MDDKYTILYDPNSKLDDWLHAIPFYSFLGFLVWLSQGSTWWTFFFGTIAFLAVAGRFKSTYDKTWRKFSSKEELIAYVENLP
jgi:hypothetical protein